MQDNLTAILQLMSLATGDEKHDRSAHSTLDILWVLYDRILRYDTHNPHSEDRDRFVLSKGHGPLAFYAILAAKGFFPTSALATFETWDSMLGAHPDRLKIPGVEASTGSLGHGLPLAVGIALALRARHSDRRVITLIGDGECNEGSIWESLLFAGNQYLSQLTCIIVNNHSSTADLSDLAAKITAFGWHVNTVDGRDHDQLYAALSHSDQARPCAIIAEINEFQEVLS